jgi:lipopolysaccharide export system protein LptA
LSLALVLLTAAVCSATVAGEPDIPVEIRGKQVEYRGKEGRAVFSGGVTVIRGSSILKCDTLETIKGSAEAIARGNVFFKDAERKIDLSCREAQYTHGLKYVSASGECQLIAGEGANLTVVTADFMELQVDVQEAGAKGNVRIVQGEAEARCGEAQLYGLEDRIVLRGRPLLLNPPHQFECDEAESFFKQGRTLLMGNVTGSLHAGTIKESR